MTLTDLLNLDFIQDQQQDSFMPSRKYSSKHIYILHIKRKVQWLKIVLQNSHSPTMD